MEFLLTVGNFSVWVSLPVFVKIQRCCTSSLKPVNKQVSFLMDFCCDGEKL